MFHLEDKDTISGRLLLCPSIKHILYTVILHSTFACFAFLRFIFGCFTVLPWLASLIQYHFQQPQERTADSESNFVIFVTLRLLVYLE